MIIGCGVDIIELDRIRTLVERYGDRFLTKVFTEGEMAYCQARKKAWQHFAGRFAAKEAVLKSLGTGIRSGITWKDVEVSVDDWGAPRITLHRGAGERARQIGIRTVHISISHCESFAVAQAVAEG
jgi:holo-[acyl-carrier protein] synthase